mgnify:CR=1 FL=1
MPDSRTRIFLLLNPLHSTTTSLYTDCSYNLYAGLSSYLLIFVFCSISFRCGGLSIERNQKPLTPENTLAVTHHNKQKQVEVKRSNRANPYEIRLFSGCPYRLVRIFRSIFLPWWINLEPSPDCHFSRCQSMPADVKSWTTFFTNKIEKTQKNKSYKAFSRYQTDLSLVGLNSLLYMFFLRSPADRCFPSLS